jgi:tetratricopeptide (TPR) repeat protein
MHSELDLINLKGGKRMKRHILALTVIAIFLVFPFWVGAIDNLAEADKIFDQGGIENYKNSIDLYVKAVEQQPDDYEASWKCARAYREYADKAKKKGIEGWKDICAQYGKAGMQYAQKAIELKPQRPDGHYYYGLNVGIYSDGVSILTALSEGLKGKTQKAFEKTYEINKMYKEGGPMLSLGRFWAVLPWPLRDRKKSLTYYREYQASKFFVTNTEAQLFLAELLIQMGGDEHKAEAKGYLENGLKSDDPYFKDWATQLQANLK